MASRRSPSPDNPAPQSIPLRTLSRPPDATAGHSRQASRNQHSSRFSIGHGRTPSILARRQYLPITTDSPVDGRVEPPLPSPSNYDHFDSPEDAHAFASAHVGLSFEGPTISLDPRTTSIERDFVKQPTENLNVLSPQDDDDLTPLTSNTGLRSAMRDPSGSDSGQRHDRQSKRSSVQFLTEPSRNSRSPRASHLGDDLPTLNTGVGPARRPSASSGILRLSSEGRRSSERSRSRSPSPSPLARAGSIFRGISERVVNISNDSEMVEQNIRRKSTIRRTRRTSTTKQQSEDVEAGPDTPGDQLGETSPSEKLSASGPPPAFPAPQIHHINPLKGKSLGIFGPENALRKWLLEVLTHPATEPIILVLIVAQTVLLAVNAAADAQYMQAESRQWGRSLFDYAIFGLFCVYTIEVIVRVIVSGFIVNATDYSSLDRSRGLGAGVKSKLGSYFTMYDKPDAKPQRRASIDFQPSIVRAFTGMPTEQGPGHSRQKQRVRLAKRAFLRHSFNRLDFIAVIAYWISFVMQLGGIDTRYHVYIFNMLSCLRILRLLGLTGGTTIILRSLKKAAPLLVNIAFLIGFFWLIFGIVGVQSFKSSLKRTCVWVGDDGTGQNYSMNLAPENIQFCGGYLNATGGPMPWLKADGSPNGQTEAKGYLCPINSLCVENELNPYNGTVSFDNIAQSMELVFVIISSNTWSDLMYYLVDSDYLISALYFAVGIVVLSLWLVNLLIAIITSCFQIIREESKQSAFTTAETDELEPEEDVSPTRVNKLKAMFAKTKPFWIVVITFDLIVMCLRSASMSDWRETFIMNTETVVTFLLLLEIIVRFACDWRHFFSSRQNCTDLLLAIVTTITQIPSIRSSGEAYAWLTVFQIARVYRVVLAVSVTRELIMLVFGNAIGLLNLIVFVFLFTFLAAILASQMFRGDIPPEDAAGNSIQVQFFDIWNSFIGMYIIFSSENWTTTLYNVTQFNLRWDTAWLGAAFCILWFIMANLIVLNMFIAVIQESFDVSEDEKRLQQMKAFLKQKEMHGTAGGNLALSSMFKMGRDSLRHRDALEYGGATMEQLLKDAVVTDFLEEQAQGNKPRPASTQLSNLPMATVAPGFFAKMWAKISGYSQKDPNPFYSHHISIRANEEFDARAMAKQVASTTEHRRRAQRQYLTRHPKYNVSLFIFKPGNPVRRICQYIVGPSRGDDRVEGVMPWKPAWYAFSAFTYAAIAAMVVIACVTTPLYQKQHFMAHDRYNNWLVWTDMGFAIIFTVEALVKIIADGFFYTPNAFFRSIWGLIDMIVLISLWISVFTTLAQEDSITRGVGAFKALRALRLLNISDSARDTFHSVIVVGGYKVLSAAFVSMSLLIPFGILGLNLFNGKFESCNDGNFEGILSNCVNEYNNTIYNWPVLAPRVVSNPSYSFDDFASALFILFQIVSQEGWTGVMQSGMAVTGFGRQPQDFSAQGNAVYFIVFNLLGAVFVLTLFISVFMRNYTEQTGVAYLTADQRSWLELRKLLKQITPAKKSLTDKTGRVQRWCYTIASKKRGRYPRFITTILLLHLALLVVEYYPEPLWWEYVRSAIFILFELVFMTNIAIRITGLTWDRFRRSSWDLFSVPAVFGAFITSLMAIGSVQNRIIEQLHKLFLVSIPFMLIPRNNQLDQLFKTAAASLPLIANLLATWFVLFLVFAIALTQAFSLTRFGANETGNVNFRNVPKALILLFRMSIGEGWNSLMEDYAQIQPPFCVIGDTFFDGDCGSEGWARGLFVAWNLISMYIFVSLFVSLIFESFSYVYQRSGGLSIVGREEIRRFKTAWAEFDPKGTGYISKETFPRLLGELSGPFSMRIYDGDFTVRNLVDDCSVQPGDSSANRRIVAGIDLDMLNARLNAIPQDEIRARRTQMEIFYQEMLLSADPEKGISFTSCLMILAHYNVISDSKSLRLEEFLRRRARIQRVQETIRRNTVIKFFDTLHWKRKFKKHQAARRDSRVDAPPQMPIPEIFIEDPEESPNASEEALARDFTETAPLSPRKVTPEVPRINTNLSRNPSTLSDRSARSASPGSSPVASPRHLSSVDTSYHGRERSPPMTPTLGGHSRQSSGVSAQGVMESFDMSAWGESLRRSFTTRRSNTMRRSDGTNTMRGSEQE
ncbi:calcium channel protein [Knufia obscura]|uniref:Calcium-channel protein CCH1 n=2 Tax=Knufia TaxID=430999 RepID=A0AAN8EJS7_9EURO|nr:calcium channel protein [Knufia obscura]KAK5952452.1 calcium channel protein [Knufia fluminis]